MKRFVLPVLTLALTALTACQSSPITPAAAEGYTYEPAGAQARYTVEVPASNTSTAAPYALQGSPSKPAALAPPVMGFQAR